MTLRSKLKPEAVRTVFLCWLNTTAHCHHCRHRCTKIQKIFMETILHQEIMLNKIVQCVLGYFVETGTENWGEMVLLNV